MTRYEKNNSTIGTNELCNDRRDENTENQYIVGPVDKLLIFAISHL